MAALVVHVAPILRSCDGSLVGVTTNAQRLQRAARSSCAVRGKRRTTPTAVSAQPAEKTIDVGKGTADPLLLRTARGEVSAKLECGGMLCRSLYFREYLGTCGTLMKLHHARFG